MTTFPINLLKISWSVSRGVNTYGYNICRLDDLSTGKRYKTCGGGYDMIGTVIGEWLQDRYPERLLKLKNKTHAVYSKKDGYQTKSDPKTRQNHGIYGATYLKDENIVSLDGACGVSTMEAIANEIGVQLTPNFNKRTRRTEGYFFSEGVK